MADVVTQSPAPPGADPAKIERPLSRIERVRAYQLLLFLFAAIFVLDQLTKAWIATRLPFEVQSGSTGAIPVIPGFFYFIHVGNPGAAWSMFTGQGKLLATLAAVTLVAIFLWRRALGLRQPVAQVCFGLLCGGIAGNLVDRMRWGYVTDFIDLHFGSYVYPTFNVADSGICVGVLLYLLHSLRTPKP